MQRSGFRGSGPTSSRIHRPQSRMPRACRGGGVAGSAACSVHGVYRRSEMDFCTDALREAVVFPVTVFCEATGMGCVFPEDLIDQLSAFSVLGKPIYGAHWYIASLISSGVALDLQGRAHMRGVAVQSLASRQDDQRDQLLHFGVERPVPRDFAPDEAIRISAKSGSVASKGDRTFQNVPTVSFRPRRLCSCSCLRLEPAAQEEAAIAAPDNSKQNNAAKVHRKCSFLCGHIRPPIMSMR